MEVVFELQGGGGIVDRENGSNESDQMYHSQIDHRSNRENGSGVACGIPEVSAQRKKLEQNLRRAGNRVTSSKR